MDAWTEVNILPASARDAERLLAEVAAPLADALRSEWDRWHYFWEPELRLRFRWRDDLRAAACRDRVSTWLDQAKADGAVSSWSETPYDGEAGDYGPELWEAVTADWMSGCDLALALIRAGRRKPHSRSWYWSRREHLFANQLSAPEVALLLQEAAGRMDLCYPASALGSPRVIAVLQAIDGYLAEDTMAIWEAGSLEAQLARALLAQEVAAGEVGPSVPARRLLRRRRPARAR